MPTLVSPVERLVTDTDVSGRSPLLSASSPSSSSPFNIQYSMTTRVRPPAHVQTPARTEVLTVWPTSKCPWNLDFPIVARFVGRESVEHCGPRCALRSGTSVHRMSTQNSRIPDRTSPKTPNPSRISTRPVMVGFLRAWPVWVACGGFFLTTCSRFYGFRLQTALSRCRRRYSEIGVDRESRMLPE